MRSMLALLALAALSLAPAASGDTKTRYDDAVREISALPYQPDYVPLGLDTAFAPQPVANTAAAQDYTSGSIAGSPDAPAWPKWFSPVTVTSDDGAPLFGYVALHPGSHPGVVVVHGFNTNAKDSVVRWAAMLYANGFDVLAADQRDFAAEYKAGVGYPTWQQTFGWKEAEDVLAAGRFLNRQPGVTSVGVMGFSLGGQDTVLALGLDGQSPGRRVYDAGLNFSGPADQDTQAYSTAAPPGCETPLCTYPASEALIVLVTPPYDTGDPCKVLTRASAVYGVSPFTILSRASAYRAQLHARVPLLSFYAADDPLVPAFEASMLAGYEAGNPIQRTFVVRRGNHAYFYDRWWQQQAVLLYFKALIGSGDPTVTTTPTVNRTAGGEPLSEQLVDLGSPSRGSADAQAAPFICDTTQPPPAFSAP